MVSAKLGAAPSSTSGVTSVKTATEWIIFMAGRLHSPPGSEDVAVEPLREPEFLSAARQRRQVPPDIGGEFFDRDRAVMIGIDIAGAGQRAEQDLGEGAVPQPRVLARILVGLGGGQHRHIFGNQP